MDIDGAIAIIGAPDSEVGGGSGSAYIYDTSTGARLRTLLPDVSPYGGFGLSVAIDGATAIVGHRLSNTNGFASGTAYLFDAISGNQTFKLFPEDADEGDYFGHAVDVSATYALIGAPLDDEFGFNTGAAYLFDITTGQQISKFVPDDISQGDRFGMDVAISGDYAIVQTHPFPDFGGVGPNAAYVFDISSGIQIAKLLSHDPDGTDPWGVSSIAIDGLRIALGAQLDDANGDASGEAYSLMIVPEPTTLALIAFGLVALGFSRGQIRATDLRN